MRNIFLEKSYTKCGDETTSRHFPTKKKKKLGLSLDQQCEFLCSLFSLYTLANNYQIILKLRSGPFVLPHIKS